MRDDSLNWPLIDEDTLRPLPPVLRAVVKALGFGRASQFLEDHGGRPHTLPKHKSHTLGLSAEELKRMRIVLAPHLDHADRITLPKPDKLFALVRDAQINKEKTYKSIAAQAREYKLSSRQLMNIRKALTKEERMRESNIKRNLMFDREELTALKHLAEEKIHSNQNPIYLKILNKLMRAELKANYAKMNVAQIDLF